MTHMTSLFVGQAEPAFAAGVARVGKNELTCLLDCFVTRVNLCVEWLVVGRLQIPRAVD